MEVKKMTEYCHYCGASLKKYFHKLTPGLIFTLAKIYKKVSDKKENIVRMQELDLNHSEYGNFQKLRFHALIAKYKINGVWKKGEWLLTKRGAEFLKGQIEIPFRVQTFRNKIVAYDIKKVFLVDVAGPVYWFEGYESFKNQLDFVEFPDNEISAPETRSITKRGKKKFCSCGGRVIAVLKPMGLSESGNMIVEKKLICNKCDFDFGLEIAFDIRS
jgi:hypothetical protein